MTQKTCSAKLRANLLCLVSDPFQHGHRSRGNYWPSMFPSPIAIAATVWCTRVLCSDAVDGAHRLGRSRQVAACHTCRTCVVTRVGAHPEAIYRS
jgi:hypothetical protein